MLNLQRPSRELEQSLREIFQFKHKVYGYRRIKRLETMVNLIKNELRRREREKRESLEEMTNE